VRWVIGLPWPTPTISASNAARRCSVSWCCRLLRLKACHDLERAEAVALANEFVDGAGNVFGASEPEPELDGELAMWGLRSVAHRRVGQELADLLSTAAGDGDLGSLLQRLRA
jgi:hypothetical protein